MVLILNLKMKKTKRRKNWWIILLFIVGLIICLYPFVAKYYYKKKTLHFVEYQKKKVEEKPKKEWEEYKSLATFYNKYIINPATKTENEIRGKEEYDNLLSKNEYLGHVEIPKLSEDIPFYLGTSDVVLNKGAGILENTSLPVGGNSTHTVVAAHTGLARAELFTALSKLNEGDVFYIHNLGETLCYKIILKQEIAPNDYLPLLVVPNKDYATLLTCSTPFPDGNRTIVRGERIAFDNDKYEYEKKEYEKQIVEKNYRLIIITVIVATAVFVLIFYLVKKKGKNEKRKE